MEHKDTVMELQRQERSRQSMLLQKQQLEQTKQQMQAKNDAVMKGRLDKLNRTLNEMDYHIEKKQTELLRQSHSPAVSGGVLSQLQQDIDEMTTRRQKLGQKKLLLQQKIQTHADSGSTATGDEPEEVGVHELEEQLENLDAEIEYKTSQIQALRQRLPSQPPLGQPPRFSVAVSSVQPLPEHQSEEQRIESEEKSKEESGNESSEQQERGEEQKESVVVDEGDGEETRQKIEALPDQQHFIQQLASMCEPVEQQEMKDMTMKYCELLLKVKHLERAAVARINTLQLELQEKQQDLERMEETLRNTALDYDARFTALQQEQVRKVERLHQRVIELSRLHAEATTNPATSPTTSTSTSTTSTPSIDMQQLRQLELENQQYKQTSRELKRKLRDALHLAENEKHEAECVRLENQQLAQANKALLLQIEALKRGLPANV
eukprot:TRINITY_DN3086_c0_g2_i1.p1 TRINITY_DN3086_c0_g2~~TRINITY_DN3086_c0_g2_i1.p1  ORF type:complete len:489 (+),score=141.89 TRINITY_DN3086_c0_g2_i1:161-1468(+)